MAKKLKSNTDKFNDVRSNIDSQIKSKSIINNGIDVLTLKRMYPGRFLEDIEKNEGFEKTTDGKYIKKINK